ncbi:L-seryl-tRNA(Sec) selenium transferase [Rhizohabitans arisaemae]|uniref:L-seryl-tRNA(Sec) selenium transferase n=1 Tax=Rhizohabitans arisaemae TaxID=2720610 RepID=UPI0024B21AD2|nr:L-seryl-tRNA(Sec) selenium transferase [Rhizohabitans arisaemae]
MEESRRMIPRTDVVLADPRFAEAVRRLGRGRVKAAVVEAQQRARDGLIAPDDVWDEARRLLPGGLRQVLNATGVILHTNLGRARLSEAAVEAVRAASGTTNVELDLATGKRARRGRDAMAVLAAAVPAAEAVHVVNNNAAALVLAATALAAGREIVVSRGELVEIGDGFRLPDLLVSTGARLREVGTTNRTHLADYAAAIGPETGFVLKIHPSNYLIEGFTGQPSVAELAELCSSHGVALVGDIGSGLLRPEPVLPEEPDAKSWLEAGADLVTASGDKLLGGPQCGLLLGRSELVERLRRHPLARALRVDKLTLAALEATLRHERTPTGEALHAAEADLLERAEHLAAKLRTEDVDATAVGTRAVVGGGGAPGVRLPSAAVSLPARFGEPLQQRAVLGRNEHGRYLLDLRAVPSEDDGLLFEAVLACR